MNCPQARDWLLQADDPRPEHCASAAVAAHLAGCAACRGLAAELVQLEEDWRALPVPAEAESSRQAFLDRLPRPTLPMTRPTQRRSDRVARWAVAALLFLGVGVALWALLPGSQAVAAPVLIEQLVDWNLNLAQATTSAERSQIFQAQQQALHRAAQQSSLPAEDRELIGLLLENGTWLSAHTDPLDEAERFSTVADKLVERLHTAAEGNDAATVTRFARLQNRVIERGVGANLAKIEEGSALNVENERRLEKVVLRDSRRMESLAELVERNPDLSRKEIRQALELSSKGQRNTKPVKFTIDTGDRPLEVGKPASYLVTVLNEGTTPIAKGRVVVILPEQVEFVSAKGPTPFRREGRHVLFRPIAVVQPGAEVRFEVQVKPQQSGVAKCRVELRAKQLGNHPLLREQQTTVVTDVH